MPEVVRAVRVPPGDRRVAWALTVDGAPVVATVHGLAMPERALVAWSDLERAVWQRPVLTVVELAEALPRVSAAGRTTSLQLADDDGRLPEVVHAGVTSSVAWSTHVRLQPAGGARVVGRRRPGADALDWQVVYDQGTDVADPALRAQAEAVVARSRSAIG